MSVEDVCGPYPAASGFADSYVDGNGATIYAPLTPAQNALYLAAVGKYQQCLAGVQGTPACPLGQYWAGSLADGRWLGHCVSDTTGQPTTPDVSIPEANVPGMAPLTGANPPGTISPPPAPVITPPLPIPTPTPATPKTPTSPATSPANPKGLVPHFIGVGPGIGTFCDMFPDDPTCDLWFGLIGLGGGDGGTSVTNETVVVYNAGLVASDVHAIVNDALSGLWGAVVSAVDVVLGSAITGIQNAVTALGNALKAAWNILTRMAGMMLNFLGHLFYEVIHGLVRAIQDVTSWLKDLYDNVLKPALEMLQRIRATLLKLWTRFVVPVLVVIQDIRRVLNILAAFHVKFAAKLDQKLAELEGKITRPLLLVLGAVNSVANWINLIITAGYLLQKTIFLNSLKAYVGSAINLQLNAMGKNVDAAAIAAANQRAEFTPAKQSADDFAQFLSDGTGTFASISATQKAQLDQYLQGNF